MRKSQVLGTMVAGLLVLMGAVAAVPAADGPIEFELDLRGEWTDNRDSTEFDEESTFDFLVTPRIEAVFDARDGMIGLFYAPSLRYRTDSGDFQNDTELYHDFGLDVNQQLSKLVSLRLNERFNYTDDPAVTEQGVRRADSSFIRNDVEAGARIMTSRRTGIDITGGHRFKAYEEDDVADVSDEARAFLELGALHYLRDTLMLKLLGRGALYDYPTVQDLDRDFNQFLAALHVENVFSRNLRGHVAAGMQWQDYESDGLGTETSPYGEVGVDVNTEQRLRMQAVLKHAVRDSDVYPFASQEFSELNGRLAWDATERVTLAGVGVYRLSDYDNDALPTEAGVAITGDETTIVGQAELIYRFHERTLLKLIQRIEDVDSDVDESFTKNTTSLVLSQQF